MRKYLILIIVFLFYTTINLSYQYIFECQIDSDCSECKKCVNRECVEKTLSETCGDGRCNCGETIYNCADCRFPLTTPPSGQTPTTPRTTTTITTTTLSQTTPILVCREGEFLFKRICESYDQNKWNKLNMYRSSRHCCETSYRYYSCQPNDNDQVCCPQDNMCVYNGICYVESTKLDVDNDGYIEICVHGSNGKWIEADCSSDNDCPAYAYCDISGSKTGVPYTCYDFRKDTSGCLIFDNCYGQCIFSKTDSNANCYVEGDEEYQEYVKNYVCPDETKIPHAMRTCPIS